MRTLTLLIALLAASPFAASQTAVEPSRCEAGGDPDATAICDQLERWREMFSATGRDERFDVEDYPGLFVEGEGATTDPLTLLTFDGYVPEGGTTQIVGLADYRDLWNESINRDFPGWTITRMDVHRVEVSGDLAWSALNFWGEGVRPGGERYAGSQHGTHGWRRVDGRWVMTHEHLTPPVRVQGEAHGRLPAPEGVAASRPGQVRPAAEGGADGLLGPAHVTLSVTEPEALARWYVEALGFEMGERFDVPDRGLSARLVHVPRRMVPDGHRFALMLMRADGSAALPDHRRSTFSDLAVQGTKRVALRVADLDAFAATLRQRGVAFDVEPRPFRDGPVSFGWAIVRDPEGNLVEIVQESSATTADASRPGASADRDTLSAQAVRWLSGWDHSASAPYAFGDQLAGFYAEGDALVLFDNADADLRVATSAAEYGAIWDAMLPALREVRNTDAEVMQVVVEGDLGVTVARWVSTFTDGDGVGRSVPTLGTLVWQRTPDGWRIVHEHGSALSSH